MSDAVFSFLRSYQVGGKPVASNTANANSNVTANAAAEAARHQAELRSLEQAEAFRIPKLVVSDPRRQFRVSSFEPSRLWTLVMGWLGQYHSPSGCWVLMMDSRYFCMKPIKLARFGLGDKEVFSFAVSGHELVRDGNSFEEMLYGKTGAPVAFIHFHAGADLPRDTIRLASIDGFYSLGNGAPPEDTAFKAVAYGYQRVAWIVESGGSGAGGAMATLTTMITVSSVSDSTNNSVIAEFVSEENNLGGCGREIRRRCEEAKINYRFIPSNNAVYDLELTYTQRVGDSRRFEISPNTPARVTRRIVVPFNTSGVTGRQGYMLPNRQNQTLVQWFEEQARR